MLLLLLLVKRVFYKDCILLYPIQFLAANCGNAVCTNQKYIVTLTADERARLHQMISAGKAAARKLLHARILLKADACETGPGWTDEQISDALEVSITTIGRVRQQCVEQARLWKLRR